MSKTHNNLSVGVVIDQTTKIDQGKTYATIEGIMVPKTIDFDNIINDINCFTIIDTEPI